MKLSIQVYAMLILLLKQIINFSTKLAEHLRKYGDEAKLPGLSQFSNRQMFWLSWARLWCVKYHPIVIKAMSADTHTVSEYRINNPLKNFGKFAEDFNCPANSMMNPNDKCKLWN